MATLEKEQGATGVAQQAGPSTSGAGLAAKSAERTETRGRPKKNPGDPKSPYTRPGQPTPVVTTPEDIGACKVAVGVVVELASAGNVAVVRKKLKKLGFDDKEFLAKAAVTDEEKKCIEDVGGAILAKYGVARWTPELALLCAVGKIGIRWTSLNSELSKLIKERDEKNGKSPVGPSTVQAPDSGGVGNGQK